MSSALTSQTRIGGSERVLACPKPHSGGAGRGRIPAMLESAVWRSWGCEGPALAPMQGKGQTSLSAEGHCGKTPIALVIGELQLHKPQPPGRNGQVSRRGSGGPLGGLEAGRLGTQGDPAPRMATDLGLLGLCPSRCPSRRHEAQTPVTTYLTRGPSLRGPGAQTPALGPPGNTLEAEGHPRLRVTLIVWGGSFPLFLPKGRPHTTVC